MGDRAPSLDSSLGGGEGTIRATSPKSDRPSNRPPKINTSEITSEIVRLFAPSQVLVDPDLPLTKNVLSDDGRWSGETTPLGFVRFEGKVLIHPLRLEELKRLIGEGAD